MSCMYTYLLLVACYTYHFSLLLKSGYFEKLISKEPILYKVCKLIPLSNSYILEILVKNGIPDTVKLLAVLPSLDIGKTHFVTF